MINLLTAFFLYSGDAHTGWWVLFWFIIALQFGLGFIIAAIKK